jgi:transcription elongation factor GreA
MAGETFLTRQGYEKLHDDLKRLKARRQELARDIQEAAEKGDLKENAEYHAAKEEQQKVQGRVSEIEEKLRTSRLIDEMSGMKAGEVRIGAIVTLKDVKDGDEMVYTLVDSAEADFSKGRISVRSPLAEALLGHKEGDRVAAKLPAGTITYQVLKVAR